MLLSECYVGCWANFIEKTFSSTELTQVLEEEGETIEQNEKMDKMTSGEKCHLLWLWSKDLLHWMNQSFDVY